MPPSEATVVALTAVELAADDLLLLPQPVMTATAVSDAAVATAVRERITLYSSRWADPGPARSLTQREVSEGLLRRDAAASIRCTPGGWWLTRC